MLNVQGVTVYQGTSLVNYQQGVSFIPTCKDQIVDSVLSISAKDLEHL